MTDALVLSFFFRIIYKYTCTFLLSSFVFSLYDGQPQPMSTPAQVNHWKVPGPDVIRARARSSSECFFFFFFWWHWLYGDWAKQPWVGWQSDEMRGPGSSWRGRLPHPKTQHTTSPSWKQHSAESQCVPLGRRSVRSTLSCSSNFKLASGLFGGSKAGVEEKDRALHLHLTVQSFLRLTVKNSEFKESKECVPRAIDHFSAKSFPV